jgi:hypothetical protein
MSIRTFSERIEDQDQLEQIRMPIREAEKIAFLGFSFGSQNMELLFGETMDLPREQSIFGTTFGMSPQNTDVLEQTLTGPITRVWLERAKCGEFLANHEWPLLRT